MAERTGEYELFQQTFLGSSITNFSISVGWNSNPSTLSVTVFFFLVVSSPRTFSVI